MIRYPEPYKVKFPAERETIIISIWFSSSPGDHQWLARQLPPSLEIYQINVRSTCQTVEDYMDKSIRTIMISELWLENELKSGMLVFINHVNKMAKINHVFLLTKLSKEAISNL